MSKQGYVYILAHQQNGVIYVGITNDIQARIQQHRRGGGSQFVKKHNIFRLVHLEEFDVVEDAIKREKQLKSWNRDWKISLIEQNNPHWQDLAADWDI